MPTLNELTRANLTRQVEWDQKAQIDISYRGNEMAGEVGETLEASGALADIGIALRRVSTLIELAIATGKASNIIKKLHREALGIVGKRATREELASELGDVIICASLTAGHQGIDLDEAVTRAFNAKTDQLGFRTRLGPPVTAHKDADAEVAGKSWIGVDLDGTLAAYDGWRGWNEIGEPLFPMLERVYNWLEEGRDVRIFTARVCFDIDVCRVTGQEFTRAQMVSAIQDWCERQSLPRLPVTNVKDIYMTELWDDRAVQMVPNTGRTLADEHAAVVAADTGRAFGSAPVSNSGPSWAPCAECLEPTECGSWQACEKNLPASPVKDWSAILADCPLEVLEAAYVKAAGK